MCIYSWGNPDNLGAASYSNQIPFKILAQLELEQTRGHRDDENGIFLEIMGDKPTILNLQQEDQRKLDVHGIQEIPFAASEVLLDAGYPSAYNKISNSIVIAYKICRFEIIQELFHLQALLFFTINLCTWGSPLALTKSLQVLELLQVQGSILQTKPRNESCHKTRARHTKSEGITIVVRGLVQSVGGRPQGSNPLAAAQTNHIT
eukprot:Gb_17642 [translate_table: standard]